MIRCQSHFFSLKAKEVREHLSKWNVESILKQCTGPEVFARLKDYVYPEINGKDHNMLLLFYVFTLNVTSPEKTIQVMIMELYAELSQTSKMELFAKIVNVWKLLTIFAKNSIFMFNWVLTCLWTLWIIFDTIYPAGNYLFKFKNRNSRTRCEMYSKLTIKTLERRHWRSSGFFIVKFEHISNLVLVFLLLTLNM